jgi:hypothetical protein
MTVRAKQLKQHAPGRVASYEWWTHGKPPWLPTLLPEMPTTPQPKWPPAPLVTRLERRTWQVMPVTQPHTR